jgi:RHS repeat-associated protein
MGTAGLEAVSTAKLLQLANATGEIIYRADSSNFATIKPQLVNFTATELSRLQGLINQGFSLIIPRNGGLRLGDWSGHAYVSVLDATATNPSAEIGMIIESGLFGGYLSTYSYLLPSAVNQIQGLNSANTSNVETLWATLINIPKPLSSDPVDMASGAFVHEHADIALGGGAPLGLAFGRSYSSNDNLRDNGLGYGWTHNYDIRLSKSSHADPVLGSRSAVDAAPMVAAFQACLEVMASTNDAANWTTAAITAKWATDQLLDNAVTAQLGGKTMEFIKLPDGSYSAPPGITTQLIDNGNNTFSLKERFGTRLDFNTQNRVSQLKDADGNAMTFTYSGNLLTSVRDAFGRSLTLSYSGNRVQSVSDSTGRSIAFGYDGDGNLTTYTDPAQKNWLYAYDQAKVCTDPAAPVPPEFRKHRLTSLTDAQGVTTAVNTYDCTGRVDTQTVKRVDAGGAPYDVTYNLYFSGYRNVEEDSAGNQSTYYYDRLGRPTDEVNALGQKATKQYDGQNQVVSATDPRGNTTTYEYDGYNNLVKVINANGETVSHRYDDPDLAGDLPLLPVTMSTDPLGNSVRHKYDSEYHRLWSKSYPAAGQEITTSATYQANGLIATTTDGRGTVTTIVPDAYGTPDTVKTAGHPAVDYNYNARGQLNNLIDQVGAQTSFLYDNRGLVTKKTDPLLQNISYQYNNNGNLSQKTDRNNYTITYAYTPSGKPRTVTYPNAATVRFTYNSLDRLESMSDSLGTTSYTYDALGRPLTTTDPHGFSLSYAYDAAGNIIAITYPGNKTLSYTYDKLNRLTRVSNWLGQAATYAYDGAGRLTSLTNFNGIITTYGFDNASRLTSITSPAASYTFSNLDGNGNPHTVQADEPLAPTVPSGATSHTYNAPKNRLLTAGSESFTYDNEGRLATGHGASYSFDYEHRLTGVGATAQYRYDGIGNRLEATRNNVITRYVYDLHGNLIAEADGANTITRYYIHGLGLMALVTPANKTYCYHFNQIGSTVAMTDMTPAMVNQYAYTPFGTIANQTEAIAQPFTFVGQMGVMTESNGFYYMRARYYDPAVRRFISEDPIGFEGGDLNLYAYVGNNPIIFIDPNGLKMSDIPGAIFKAFSGAGNALVDIAQNGPTEAKALMAFAAATEIVPLAYAAAISAPVTAMAPSLGSAIARGMVAAGSPIAQQSIQATADFVSSYFVPGPPSPSVAGYAGSGLSWAVDQFSKNKQCGK